MEIRIRQWSPYVETGRYVVWNGEQAQVWIWDERARTSAAENAVGKKATVLPETVLRVPLKGSGARLAACIDGFEGQIWQDGVLLAGRWWEKMPVDTEWSRFLLANDLPPADSLPLAPPWLSRPWARDAGQTTDGLRNESFWVTASFTLIAIALVWHLGLLWKWEQGKEALARNVDVLNKKAQPLLAARSQALQDRQTAERLAALTAQPKQVQLLTTVIRALPAGVDLSEWHYLSETLSVTLQGGTLDPSFYVKKFQEIHFFNEVLVEAGSKPGQLTLKMKVKPIPS